MADVKPLKLVDQGYGVGRLAEFETGDTLPKAALPALSAADVGAVAADDILGTVSQSDGVPTGAIIERGSNANGNYVRYADGTQICWCQGTDAYFATTADGPIYRSNGDNTWTFPAAFIDIGSTSAFASAQASFGRWFNARVSSALSAEITRQSSNSDSTTRSYRAMAIGRWY